jgi:hypothetical protein
VVHQQEIALVLGWWTDPAAHAAGARGSHTPEEAERVVRERNRRGNSARTIFNKGPWLALRKTYTPPAIKTARPQAPKLFPSFPQKVADAKGFSKGGGGEDIVTQTSDYSGG